MSALVSILLPVYNTAPFLAKCLDSVLAQSYENLQVILVDDGSTDESLLICKKYSEQDKRIEVYHKENEGVAATRNYLLSLVKGDFILFVDSDDWIEPDMVEYLLLLQVDSSADLVVCGMVENDFEIASSQTPKITNLLQSEVIDKFLMHTEFRGTLWNKLFKTGIVGDERFDTHISFGEDSLFCWHVLQHVKNVAISEKACYHYRLNSNSLSHEVFGPKKMSAHFVWEQICNETAIWWPNSLFIAQARHCIEDTLLLRNASSSGFSDKESIRILQSTIKALHKNLFKVNITSLKMKIYSWLVARSYWIAGKI